MIVVNETCHSAGHSEATSGLMVGKLIRGHIKGFPKLGVPFLGVPIIRTIVFWGLYWGPLILGNYHIKGYK